MTSSRSERKGGARPIAEAGGAPEPVVQEPICRDVSHETDRLLYCGPPLDLGADLPGPAPTGEGAARALREHLRQHPEPAGALALTLPLDGPAAQPHLPELGAPVRLVFWRVRQPPDADCLRLLRQRAREGVWNAVLSDARTPAAAQTAWDAAAAADPVVVHGRLHQAPDGTLQTAEIPFGYGETADLEGRPLWTRLADPAALLRAVVQHGTKSLCRLRVTADGAPFTLGSALEYRFEPPEQMNPAIFEEVLRLVAAGGAVTTERVRENLQHAFLIGVVTERGRVVADSSFKHPREAYIETVLQQAGFDLRGFLERGYTSVRPEYRGLGIGTKLLAGLTARAQGRKFYSIIAEDNEATKTMARRNNTVQVGSFFSEKMGKPVGIWTAAEFADNVGR